MRRAVVNDQGPGGTETSDSRHSAPWWGSSRDRQAALATIGAAMLVTAVYVAVARQLDTPTTWLERVALVASLACVWLARTENIWTMPLGIVSVLALGWFYLDIALVAQGWLQFLFYVPIQMIGWWTWTRGGTLRTELPVTALSSRGRLAALVGGVILWSATLGVFSAIYDAPRHLVWDTSIVASSVVAQTLMTAKKVASWFWWTVPVNVSSIGLYVVTESWAFVFLYAVFLANSLAAWREWSRRLRSRMVEA